MAGETLQQRIYPRCLQLGHMVSCTVAVVPARKFVFPAHVHALRYHKTSPCFKSLPSPNGLNLVKLPLNFQNQFKMETPLWYSIYQPSGGEFVRPILSVGMQVRCLHGEKAHIRWSWAILASSLPSKLSCRYGPEYQKVLRIPLALNYSLMVHF